MPVVPRGVRVIAQLALMLAVFSLIVAAIAFIRTELALRAVDANLRVLEQQGALINRLIADKAQRTDDLVKAVERMKNGPRLPFRHGPR